MKDEDKVIYFENVYNPYKRIDRLNFRFLFVLIVLSPGFVLVGTGIITTILQKRNGLVFGYQPEVLYDEIAIFLGSIILFCMQ